MSQILYVYLKFKLPWASCVFICYNGLLKGFGDFPEWGCHSWEWGRGRFRPPCPQLPCTAPGTSLGAWGPGKCQAPQPWPG